MTLEERAASIADVSLGTARGALRRQRIYDQALKMLTEARTDEVLQLRAALKDLTDMYTHAWDLVDGGLIMLPPSIPRFEAAHNAAMLALGIKLVDPEEEEAA